jgi:hypothetical protein
MHRLALSHIKVISALASRLVRGKQLFRSQPQEIAPMFVITTTRAIILSAAVLLALGGLPATAQTTMPETTPTAGTKAAQKAKDLEHELVQSDGVNHPREIVKSRAQAPKKAPQAAKKTQRDLDHEHEQVQSDGVNHPLEKVTEKAKPSGKPAPRTQRDLDREHEQVKSDGVSHPRELIKK